jgi:site-specific DNA-methyltransferase (adenine-specific)
LDRGISCWFIQKIGKKYASETDVQDNYNLLHKYKILVPKAPIAGQTDFSKPIRIYHNKNAFLAKPGECCTESYIVAGAFDTEIEAINYRSYLFTKICRFLILLTMISQDVNRKNFIFVPQLSDYNNKIDDSILVKMWGITEDEWKYIDSRILSIDSENVDA